MKYIVMFWIWITVDSLHIDAQRIRSFWTYEREIGWHLRQLLVPLWLVGESKKSVFRSENWPKCLQVKLPKIIKTGNVHSKWLAQVYCQLIFTNKIFIDLNKGFSTIFFYLWTLFAYYFFPVDSHSHSMFKI